MPEKIPRIEITVQLDEDVITKLEGLAKERIVPRTRVIRDCINYYLRNKVVVDELEFIDSMKRMERLG